MALGLGNVTNPAQVTGVNTVSFSHDNNGDGLVVSISSWASAGSTVLSCTYNAVATAAEGSAVDAAFDRVTMRSLIAPTSGSNTLAVTMSGNSDIIVGAVSYTGSNQSDLCGTFNSATGTNTSPTVNITSVSGDIVQDVLTWFTDPLSTTATAGAGQTRQWARTVANVTHGAGSTETATTTTTTMSWTTGTPVDGWIVGGIAVKEAAAGVTTRSYKLTTLGVS